MIRGIDTADMVGRVREMPRQLALARRVAAAVDLPATHRDVDAVCVLAMGGSAIGAELVAGIAGDRLRVPLMIHRDYGLPAWTSERTLVIAASKSGETVETVSGLAEAREPGPAAGRDQHRRAARRRGDRDGPPSCATNGPASRAPRSASASAWSTSCSHVRGC